VRRALAAVALVLALCGCQPLDSGGSSTHHGHKAHKPLTKCDLARQQATAAQVTEVNHPTKAHKVAAKLAENNAIAVCGG